MQVFNSVTRYGTAYLRSFSRLSPQLIVYPSRCLQNQGTSPSRAFQLLSQRWQSTSAEAQKGSKSQATPALEEGEDERKTSKKVRPGGRKTSLRTVAVEAQRSRDKLVLGTKWLRFVNPDIDTKACIHSRPYSMLLANHAMPLSWSQRTVQPSNTRFMRLQTIFDEDTSKSTLSERTFSRRSFIFRRWERDFILMPLSNHLVRMKPWATCSSSHLEPWSHGTCHSKQHSTFWN